MSIDSNDAVVAPQLYFQFADMNFDNQKIQLEVCKLYYFHFLCTIL